MKVFKKFQFKKLQNFLSNEREPIFNMARERERKKVFCIFGEVFKRAELVKRSSQWLIFAATQKLTRMHKIFFGIFHCKNFPIEGPWWCWSSGHRAHLHSYNPSSNPSEIYNLSGKLFRKEQKLTERGQRWHIFWLLSLNTTQWAHSWPLFH